MQRLNLFFHAKSIAVVGASPHPLKVGHQILRNLQQVETAGGVTPTPFTLYPVHPTAQRILGLQAYPNLTAIAKKIDLVIIATPAPTVSSLVDEIITRNFSLPAGERVKAVLIVTAGFAEMGAEGTAAQNLIAQKLELSGIALLGPNSLGFLNPEQQLNASFAEREMYPGRIGLISQSGAMLTALFDALHTRELGFSFAVSLGNKAGMNENDCLEYALNDPRTTAVLLYLESFADIPRFLELASELRQRKPVVVLKGGTSQRGQQASVSHTAALATNQVLLAVAAEQVGFTLVDTVQELIEVAVFLAAHHHLPENAMVLTNAGGPAVNTVDRLQAVGVKLAAWSPRATEELQEHLPQVAVHNPMDLLGDASPERFGFALQVAQRDLNIDAVVGIVTPQAVTDMKGMVEQAIAHRGKKPLFLSLIGGDELEPLRAKLRAAGITANRYPDESVDLLGLLGKMGRATYEGRVYKPANEAGPGTDLLAHASTLTLSHTFQLLAAYGLRLPAAYLITSADAKQFARLPYPLFAKTANLSIAHKKDVGAVFGLVHNFTEAAKAYAQLAPFGNEVLFQEVLPIDLEILLGAEKDPQFGWYISVGLGGSLTNILADRQYVFLRATKTQLREAWLRTKAAAVLREQPDTSEQVVECLTQMQKLVLEHPELSAVEINPLAINSRGVWVADVKVR